MSNYIWFILNYQIFILQIISDLHGQRMSLFQNKGSVYIVPCGFIFLMLLGLCTVLVMFSVVCFCSFLENLWIQFLLVTVTLVKFLFNFQSLSWRYRQIYQSSL